MKGKLIKKDDSWLVEYKEDFCDGVAVHLDYWTFSVPVRYIDVRNLIFKDIIKEGDIVDFEFTLERSIREPLAKMSEDPHSINIGDLQTLEHYRDELIMLLNDKQQTLTPVEIKGINRELKNITNKLKS